jgi:hypothetical protein
MVARFRTGSPFHKGKGIHPLILPLLSRYLESEFSVIGSRLQNILSRFGVLDPLLIDRRLHSLTIAESRGEGAVFLENLHQSIILLCLLEKTLALRKASTVDATVVGILEKPVCFLASGFESGRGKVRLLFHVSHHTSYQVSSQGRVRIRKVFCAVVSRCGIRTYKRTWRRF